MHTQEAKESKFSEFRLCHPAQLFYFKDSTRQGWDVSRAQAEVGLSSFKSLDFFALILDFLNTALMKEGGVIKGQHRRSLCISFQLLP